MKLAMWYSTTNSFQFQYIFRRIKQLRSIFAITILIIVSVSSAQTTTIFGGGNNKIDLKTPQAKHALSVDMRLFTPLVISSNLRLYEKGRFIYAAPYFQYRKLSENSNRELKLGFGFHSYNSVSSLADDSQVSQNLYISKSNKSYQIDANLGFRKYKKGGVSPLGRYVEWGVNGIMTEYTYNEAAYLDSQNGILFESFESGDAISQINLGIYGEWGREFGIAENLTFGIGIRFNPTWPILFESSKEFTQGIIKTETENFVQNAILSRNLVSGRYGLSFVF